MKIAIIGPLCSGKSTLANDLMLACENVSVIEEAHRRYHDEGIVVPIAENTTMASSLLLFNRSCKQVLTTNDAEQVTIILGSPFEEFMYTYHASKIVPNSQLDHEYLQSLIELTLQSMQEYDLILKIDHFQDIPYYRDAVRPDKDVKYRDKVNDTINELLSEHSPYQIIDAAIKSRIRSVSGTREERMRQCKQYIGQLANNKLRCLEGAARLPNCSR